MTDALLDEVIDLIASACFDKPIRLGTPHSVTRDRAWKRHRAEAIAACAGLDLCPWRGCLRAAVDGQWCHRHAPDEVAIERAAAGERLELMPHERAATIRLMSRRGIGWTEIQESLGVSGRTITKALADAA